MSKLYLDYEQQIEKLVNETGLIISDRAFAREMLVNVGYFSLIGGYKNLFINSMTGKYDIPTTLRGFISSVEINVSISPAIRFYVLFDMQNQTQLWYNS